MIIALVIVLGLGPSLVVLSLILMTTTPKTWLSVVQIILFFISVGVFLFLGFIGDAAAQSVIQQEKEKAQEDK